MTPEYEKRFKEITKAFRGDSTEALGALAQELNDEITILRAALAVSINHHRLSAEQFTFYAEQHRAKSPPDEAKAATNDAHAERCRDAMETGDK
jgi:hypothetical protein